MSFLKKGKQKIFVMIFATLLAGIFIGAVVKHSGGKADHLKQEQTTKKQEKLFLKLDKSEATLNDDSEVDIDISTNKGNKIFVYEDGTKKPIFKETADSRTSTLNFYDDGEYKIVVQRKNQKISKKLIIKDNKDEKSDEDSDDNSEEDSDDSEDSEDSEETDDASSTSDTTEDETSEPEPSTPTPAPEPTKPTPSMEQSNALAKAGSYSRHLHLSKSGIYKQLTSPYGEKFSAEAGQYAVDNLVANYNENALESARSYQRHLHLSTGRLFEQLTSEYGSGFTADEANYAISHL